MASKLWLQTEPDGTLPHLLPYGQVRAALEGRLRGTLGAAFSDWRSAAAGRTQQRQLLQRALGRLTQRCQSAAFLAWRDAAAQRAAQARLVQGAILR